MWLKSVTKAVFFMMAFTVCFAYMTGYMTETTFKEFALMAFAAFFTAKQIEVKRNDEPRP